MMIAAELPWTAPDVAFLALSGPGVAFLDSSAHGDPRANVSYLCLAPEATIALEDKPFSRLRDWMATHQPVQLADWPFPFKGGAVGWLGYDIARQATDVQSSDSTQPCSASTTTRTGCII